MTDSHLSSLVLQLVEEVRALTRHARQDLPAVLTKARAAKELSISLSKLKGLIRTGEVAVCEVGSTTMVPASEVLRIAGAQRRASSTPSPRRPKRPRSASSPSPTEEAAKVRRSLKPSPRRSR